MFCFVEEAYVSKYYEIYLPVKVPMFLEVMKYSHKFANLKNAN